MSAIVLSNISISGDCSLTNTGAISFSFTGSTPPWTIYEGPTTSGLLPSSAYTSSDITQYYAGGLPAGQYFLTISDATAYRIVQSFYISSGTSVSIDAEGTTCALNNGKITGSTPSSYGLTTFSLYDFSDNFITSANTAPGDTSFVFTNLSANTYYLIGDDGAGCTGKSASVIIKSSTTFDFGAYVVNDSSCVSNQGAGKIFITGLTIPTSAYTIDWITKSGGQSGLTATGLTQGFYTIKITDENGCIVSKTFQVSKVPSVGIGSLIVVQPPSCSGGDGQVTVIVTGGTAPYFYYGSNGTTHVDFAPTYTFTGLSGGIFQVTVTDSGLCSATKSVSLVSPNSFNKVAISTISSICNNNSGSITINIGAGTPGIYSYTLSGSNGTLNVIPNGSLSQTFNNLSSGNYIITIDKGGCVYTGTTKINNVNKFTVSAITIGTTCCLNNGEISATVSSGATFPVKYKLTGPTPAITNITQNSGYFTNLAPGNYTLEVTDSDVRPCTQTLGLYIQPSTCVDFTYSTTQPTLGNDGIIDVYITKGAPPFTLTWDPVITGQTGTTLSGLTYGTYKLTVTDSNLCYKTQDIVLSGTKYFTSFEVFNICEDNFENTKALTKRGIIQMYNEGFYDLTSGDTNCILTASTFTAQAVVGTQVLQQTFYSGTSINDYPTDYEWSEAIKDLFSQFDGIDDIIIDFTNNTIKLINNCDEIVKNCQVETYNSLADKNIKLNLLINYNIACVSCT